MAKFSGKIGFLLENTEIRPGVYKDVMVEKHYQGDVLDSPSSARYQSDSDTVNDNLIITNLISIVGNPFMFKHYPLIKYVRWMGTAIRVRTIQLKGVRLILTLGEVWNGETA